MSTSLKIRDGSAENASAWDLGTERLAARPSTCLAKHEVAERHAQRVQIWHQWVDGGRQRKALAEAPGDVGEQTRGFRPQVQRCGCALRKGRAEAVAKAACRLQTCTIHRQPFSVIHIPCHSAPSPQLASCTPSQDPTGFKDVQELQTHMQPLSAGESMRCTAW